MKSARDTKVTPKMIECCMERERALVLPGDVVPTFLRMVDWSVVFTSHGYAQEDWSPGSYVQNRMQDLSSSFCSCSLQLPTSSHLFPRSYLWCIASVAILPIFALAFYRSVEGCMASCLARVSGVLTICSGTHLMY